MTIKTRLSRAEQAAGAGEDDPLIIIVRHAHDYDGLIEDLPETISQGGKVIRRGINTIPEHLRKQHIQLAWPEDE